MDGSQALELLADRRRRAIVELVWEDERAASDIAAALPDITFGAVSQHLRKLREAGLVVVRREGRHRYYRAERLALGPLADALDAMWSRKLDDLVALAEAEEAGVPPSGSEDDEPREGR